MKKILYMLVLAAVAVACNMVEKDIPLDGDASVAGVKMITEVVSGSSGSFTKATIADSDDASFKWTKGDDIAVHVSKGDSHKYVFTSASGASGASVSEATASFIVADEEGYTRDAFAVYPSTIVSESATNYGQSGAALDVTLPASYTLDQVTGETSPCPMIATNVAGSGWNFYQLCSLLRLTVNDIPADTKRLVISFDGKQVSGSFSVASPVTPNSSVIATSADATHDCITITKDGTDQTLGATSLVLNIPLPVGTYSDLTVVAYDALTDGNLLLVGTVSFAYTADITKGVKKSTSLNLSSLFRLTFKNGNTTLSGLRFVRIFSSQNKLHNGATTFGPYTSPNISDLSNPMDADLLFDENPDDLIAFQVIDADGKVYSGSLAAPTGGFKKDKYYDLEVNVFPYTFTVASGKKVYFSPGDLGVDEGVYSFTEPFTTWAHGNTDKADYLSEAPAKRVWFDWYYDSGLATGTVYGISGWRIPKKVSTEVASYEWNYLVDSRTMNSGVARYYKVTIPGYKYCLLLPPDETQSSDIGTDLTSGDVSDYAKYLGKGFVLLFNTNRGMYASNTFKWSWLGTSSPYINQGWYWAVYNDSNRYYFTWPDAGPKVDWGTNRMRNHIRYIRDVQ